LHMAQLMMPLLPIISCFITIQIGSTFLVPAYPGCPGKEEKAVKRVPMWLMVEWWIVLSQAHYKLLDDRYDDDDDDDDDDDVLTAT